MSATSVVNAVELVGEQLFDHKPQVRAEIERFADQFERNERHKEFDGILRASHSLVEAAETQCEALFDDGRVKTVIGDIDSTTQRIQGLLTPKYQKEHEEYLTAVRKAQDAYLELCTKEAERKKAVQHEDSK